MDAALSKRDYSLTGRDAKRAVETEDGEVPLAADVGLDQDIAAIGREFQRETGVVGRGSRDCGELFSSGPHVFSR